MSFSSLLIDTVTVISRAEGGADAFGDPTLGEVIRVDYKGRVQGRSPSTPQKGEELLTGRDTVISTYDLFLPADAIIGPLDLVMADGTTYEVMGEPVPIKDRTGVHHIETLLRRVTG